VFLRSLLQSIIGHDKGLRVKFFLCPFSFNYVL
jgi:hypothetical protein